MKLKRLLFYIFDIILLAGGMILAVCYCSVGRTQSEAFTSSVGFLALIIAALLLILIVIEFVSYCKIADSTQHTVFIAAALALYYFTSRDVMQFFGYYFNMPNLNITDDFNFLFLTLTALSVIYFLNYQYKIGLKKIHALILCGAAVLCVCAYIALSEYNLQYIAFIIFFCVTAGYLLTAFVIAAGTGRDDYTFYISTAIIACVFGMGAADILGKSGVFDCGTLGYPLGYMATILLLFAAIYIAFIVQTERRARVAGEYKLLYERTKFNALCGQIKPHFIFNVLSTIKALYRINPDSGDEAVDIFSRHMRANVEAATKDLIPFEKELDYADVYVRLENLKREKPLDVIYDIDFTDFYVPILSLQPYIENAIKYGKLAEREDGHIKISSAETDEGVTLEIADNGVGFDPSRIGENSYGISNSKTRFELLLGVEPQIISAPGKGTTVRIFIPREKIKKYSKFEETRQ